MGDQENRGSDENELLRVLSQPAVGVPHAATPEVRKSFIDRRRAQAEAYGQFIASSPIYVPGTGTLAFNTDAQVPIEHVEKWELEAAGLVHRIATPDLARVGRRFDDDKGGAASEAGPSGEPIVVPASAAPPAPAPVEDDVQPLPRDADDDSSAKPRKSTTAAKSR